MSKTNPQCEITDLTDTPSALAWSPKANHLAVSSWDSNVYVYNIQFDDYNVGSNGLAKKSFQAAVLDISWSDSGEQIYVACANNEAYCWDVKSDKVMTIAKHQQPIKCIKPIRGTSMVVTGGWDGLLKYTDMNNGTALDVAIGERIYAIDTAPEMVVVSTAQKRVYSFDVNANPSNYSTALDLLTLTFPGRAIAIFPNKGGFLVGSINGRVNVTNYPHRTQTSQSLNNTEFGYSNDADFSFKCHREETDSNLAYPVNQLQFHPTEHTFLTAGSDGTVVVWDKDNKKKITSISSSVMRNGTKKRLPVLDAKFSTEGNLLAYCVGYDWAEGVDGYTNESRVIVRKLNVVDVQRKQ